MVGCRLLSNSSIYKLSGVLKGSSFSFYDHLASVQRCGGAKEVHDTLKEQDVSFNKFSGKF